MELWNNIMGSDKKKRSMLFSIGAHIVLIILLLYPWLSYQNPPPEQQGVLVTFGMPEVGEGDDLPIAQNEEPTETPQETVVEKVDEVEQVEESQSTASAAPEKTPEVLTSKQKEAIRIKEVKAAEAKKKKQAEEAAKAAELEKQKQAEAQRKAEAKKQADAKKKFSSVFGSGRGNTGEAGNQGDPDGDPDKGKLTGISTGSGMVGGGLGSRGLASSPKINDRSQKAGKVVVDVCVDRTGKVISAQYTQRGSTTTDSELREIAEKNASKFHFTPSNIDKQCGTITIDFKLK